MLNRTIGAVHFYVRPYVKDILILQFSPFIHYFNLYYLSTHTNAQDGHKIKHIRILYLQMNTFE